MILMSFSDISPNFIQLWVIWSYNPTNNKNYVGLQRQKKTFCAAEERSE